MTGRMSTTTPPHCAHRLCYGQVGLPQQRGQQMCAKVHQETHRGSTEPARKHSPELRHREMHQRSKFVKLPVVFRSLSQQTCGLLSSGEAHRRLLRFPRGEGAGGEDPVVLNRSTQASGCIIRGRAEASMPCLPSQVRATCGEGREVARARIWARPFPGLV